MTLIRLTKALLLAATLLADAGLFVQSFSTTLTTNNQRLVQNKAPLTPSTTPTTTATSPTQLAATPDLDTIALVVGQENYGLALVALGEGVYSFVQAPSFGNIKVLLPPAIAAAVLVAAAGPLITSGDAASVGTGLWIATGTSLGLGASYILRLLAPPSDTFVPKEVAALALVIAVAGFFSFAQNLIVDGFVTLPQLPQLLPMPPADNGI